MHRERLGDMNLYRTKGICEKMPFSLQAICLELFMKRKLEGGLDYFHIFELSVTEQGKQRIYHKQEQPSYESMVEIEVENPIELKIWMIDEVEHVTLLLPEEY